MRTPAIVYTVIAFLMCWTRAGAAQDPPLAPTPPMGWNSWNHFQTSVSDAIVRAAADAMVSSGMKAVGYSYLVIDDGWQGQRDARGELHPNQKFPDMKALADYVHGKGLKLGIYSSPGPKTCEGFEGSFGHEEQDAQMFAQWGMDLLKYDLCSYEGRPDQQAAYKKMGDALRKTGRQIVYSLCQYGEEKVWTWGKSVGAQLWRTDDDIRDNYYVMAQFGFGQNGLEQFAGPGNWNDPDMLEIGNGGMNEDESRTHMTLWCLLAAPLFAGNELTKMNATTIALLTNSEVIAIDQDSLGAQGRRVAQEGPLEVWMKPLADGSKAVGLFNRGWGPMPVTSRFDELGIAETAEGGKGWARRARIRDLWAHKELGEFTGAFTVNVPQHGAAMIRVH